MVPCRRGAVLLHDFPVTLQLARAVAGGHAVAAGPEDRLLGAAVIVELTLKQALKDVHRNAVAGAGLVDVHRLDIAAPVQAQRLVPGGRRFAGRRGG